MGFLKSAWQGWKAGTHDVLGRVRFDFNTAVAAARTDYPEETANVTFVDASAPAAAEQIRAWLDDADPSLKHKFFENSTSAEYAKEIVATGAVVYTDIWANRKLLVAPSKPKTKLSGGGAREAHFIFNHELGHVLTPHGIIVSGDDARERIADVFSLLRGRKQGVTGAKETDHLIVARALEGGSTHRTANTLYGILPRKELEQAKDLTLQQIKELAVQYGAANPPGFPGAVSLICNLWGKRLGNVCPKG